MARLNVKKAEAEKKAEAKKKGEVKEHLKVRITHQQVDQILEHEAVSRTGRQHN